MDDQEIKSLIAELMEISEACYLTTIDENNLPETRALLNLRNSVQFPGLIPIFKSHNADFLAYFTTNTSSRKINQIRNNPNVSVFYSKPDQWHGLMLGGKIEIVNDITIKKSLWQNNWLMYYPKGVNDPDYTILRLKPSVLRFYHKLQSYKINID